MECFLTLWTSASASKTRMMAKFEAVDIADAVRTGKLGRLYAPLDAEAVVNVVKSFYIW